MKSSLTTIRNPHTPLFRPAIILAAAMLLVTPWLTHADGGPGRNENPQVLPPHSRPFGHSYGEWAAAWWQWALGVPLPQNPVLDPTGEFAAVNQSGKVWFLAGNFVSGTYTRSVTLAPGTALFFPLANQAWVSYPTDPPWNQPYLDTTTTPPTPWPSFEDYVRTTILAPPIDSAKDLSCQIDGREIHNLTDYRHQSPSFMVELPADNLFGIDPGLYGPSADDGIYLMLAPLSAGHHTIHFTMSNVDGSFALDVTYLLKVKKGDRD
jgi:hypothetical protein